MSYEFKKLSDVDVVAEPTESANVLIEENGVIKKAPKTAVGGGSEPIRIIHELENDSISCNYSYDEIVNLLDNKNTFGLYTRGEQAYNWCFNCIINSIALYSNSDMNNSVANKDDADYILIGADDSNYSFKCYRDNTIEFVSNDGPS